MEVHGDKCFCKYLYLRVMKALTGEETLLKNVRCTSGKSDNSKKKEIAPLGIGSKYFRQYPDSFPSGNYIFFFTENHYSPQYIFDQSHSDACMKLKIGTKDSFPGKFVYGKESGLIYKEKF